ncbi:MAG: amidohydrolase family protein, partial [Candidatus Bathyarchaeia archaeon]
EESLSVGEALRGYTVDAAFASFEENLKGTIEVGKFADLTVLSDDLFGVSAEKIRDVRVDMTVVGGKIVFMREGLSF